MSATPTRRAALVERIGHSCRLGEFVVGLVFLADGTLVVALGDGTVCFLQPRAAVAEPERVAVHRGACLTMVRDADGEAVLTGGDDGRLVRTAPGRGSVVLHAEAGAWVEPLGASPRTGMRAAASARTVHLLEAGNRPVAELDHPSSAAGLAFSPDGRRLGVAHYGGVTLWRAGHGAQTPRRLGWQGSHLGLTFSPSGRFLVSAMQENALHGWCLPDGADMSMAGYPARVKSMSWLPKGRFLATGGAHVVICWPFSGKRGPMGKAPQELGGAFDGVVTMVAAHPIQDVVAAGYEDGAVILVHVGRTQSALVRYPGNAPVSALGWSPDGRTLALGTEDGALGIVTLDEWSAPKAAGRRAS